MLILDDSIPIADHRPELIRQQKLELSLGKALLAAKIPLDGSVKDMLADKSIDWKNIFRGRAVAEFCDKIDTNRLVMVPPGWCLVIRSKHSFRAELKDGDILVDLYSHELKI